MTETARKRILIAGMGNVLRGDDGFGVAVADVAAGRSWGDDGLEVEVMEVGIGGFELVQRLHEGWEALIIADAVDREAEPGRLFVLEPTVPDAGEMDPEQRRSVMAETHQLVPARVLVMARGLGVLPDQVLILGCQGDDVEELGMELSPAVREAVPRAVERLEALVAAYRRDGRFPSAGAGSATDQVREPAP